MILRLPWFVHHKLRVPCRGHDAIYFAKSSLSCSETIGRIAFIPEIAAPEIAVPEIAVPDTTAPDTTAPEIAVLLSRAHDFTTDFLKIEKGQSEDRPF